MSDMKKCPRCGKFIKAEANFCVYCGSRYEDSGKNYGRQPEPEPIPEPAPRSEEVPTYPREENDGWNLYDDGRMRSGGRYDPPPKKEIPIAAIVAGLIAAACLIAVVFILLKSPSIPGPGKGKSKGSETTSAGSKGSDDTGETVGMGNPTYITGKSNRERWLNLRQEPDANAAVIKELPESTCVALLDDSYDEYGNQWMKIYVNGMTGWIEADHLRYLTDESVYLCDETMSKTTAFIIYDGESRIKTHSKPNQSSPYVLDEYDGLEYGTEITILELSNGFGKIDFGGQESWIDMYYVRTIPVREDGSVWDSWMVEICEKNNEGNPMRQINLRKEPSSGSKSLGKIYTTELLTLDDFYYGWGRTNYRGKTGWVYLRHCSPCPPEGMNSEDY